MHNSFNQYVPAAVTLVLVPSSKRGDLFLAWLPENCTTTKNPKKYLNQAIFIVTILRENSFTFWRLNQHKVVWRKKTLGSLASHLENCEKKLVRENWMVYAQNMASYMPAKTMFM